MRLPVSGLTRLCAFAVCLSGFLAQPQVAQAQQLTVARLVESVTSSIKLKNPDKDVAIYLARVKLTEKLTPAVVDDLQSAGAGPKTVAALEALMTQSAALPAPPVKVVQAGPPKVYGPPEPSDTEKKTVLEEARDFALNYVKSLPNFLSLQLTNRSVDMHFQPGAEGSWTPMDRLVEKLTFFDQKEKYELIQHNETSTVGKTWESLGGSISRGEFGSLLGQIFEPQTHTDFQWQRWGTLDGKLTHVYQYRVEQAFSQETISQGQQKITAGYHGFVYIQKGPNVVLRIRIIPDIPPDFPVQDVDQTLDYRYQDIGSQTYLLPIKSTVQMRDGHQASLNEIEWRKYQKYSADTVIKFDESDDKPLPEDKTKETAPPKK